MLAIGNDELTAAPELGDTYACPRCNAEHPVNDSTPPGLLQSVRCGEKVYLVGIKWKALPPPRAKP